jgi:amino acid adenylation domain-containing protein
MASRDISKNHTRAAGQNVKERDYWLNKLAGDWTRISFQYDNAGTSEEKVYDRIAFDFSGAACANLAKLSNRSDFRLFMILASQLVLLLYKYTGNKDIIVGAPIYKQEVQGDFINTVLPLRNSVSSGMTIKELLLQMRETIAEAAEHQNYPLESLLHRLDLPAGGEDFPLFDISILLENVHHKSYIQHVDTNMTFVFRETGSALEGELEYNRTLFNPVTVEDIAKRFVLLAERVMDYLDTPLADFDILEAEERELLLHGFNDTRADFPTDGVIHRLFREQAQRTPDTIAVTDPPPESGDRQPRTYTYRQLDETSDRLAHMLRQKGVRRGDVVALLMESCIDRAAGVLGILKAGAAYQPIDPEYPEKRVQSILAGCHAALLVSDSTTMNKYSYTRLKNLHRFPSQPVLTGRRPQILDFDTLPYPDRSLIDYLKYRSQIGHAVVKHTVSLQATRGCPYNCAFCHKIWPKKHISRSADDLFEEVEMYYRQGVRNFSFVDDIINLDIPNSTAFFKKIIDSGMKDARFFFPNGVRGDILTKDYIDLMVEAGVVSIGFALETASPRLQKLIGKNLNLERFRSNYEYIAATYPQVFLELFTMLGFPTETEEEAMMTFDFIKSIKWIHFPYVFILKVFPNTDMAKLAMDHGIGEEAIVRSANMAFHELPETLPFSRDFVLQYQTRFTNEYFLNKERLLHVLPHQMRICTEDELVQKYDNYLPMKIRSLEDILNCAGITMEELGAVRPLEDTSHIVPPFYKMPQPVLPARTGKQDEPLRVLLIDVSNFFSGHGDSMLYGQVIEPLGLMYLLTYLKREFGDRVIGKIAKARVDMDSYDDLRRVVEEFDPDIIGIRALSFYKEFFHEAVAYIRNMGVNVPIVSGGPYATSDYEYILQDPEVNLVVMGEGEVTFAELIGKMIENNKQLPPEEVLQNIQGLAFVRRQDKPRLTESGRELLLMDRLARDLERFPAEDPGNVNTPDDLLYLISTSGSTGVPKSVMLEHRNLINLLQYQFNKTDIDFSSRVLQFASIGFDVSAQEMFSTLLGGGQLYLVTDDMKTDIQRLFDWIEANSIEIFFLPPAFLKLVFNEPEYTARFPRCIKHIIAAGEQLEVPPALREHIKEHGVYLHNHYGPSETHVVTALTLGPDDHIPRFPSIGKPIANTSIYILDENHNPLPVGVAGDLYIGGSNVGRGYFNNEQLTAEKFVPSPFTHHPSPIYKTGDLANWLPDGTIRFRGRKDYQVKIRGFRIELEEIEAHLKAVDFIRQAVVLDRESSRGSGADSRYLCAYIVADDDEAVSRLRNRLRESLPEYMMPAHFVRIERIPMTASGKVNRKLLPDPEVTSDEKYIAPRDVVEEKLCDIWSDILGVEKHTIGIDANFFQLGGHSLKATILISRIHKTFNVKTSLGEMFNRPTIRALAESIKETETRAFTSIPQAEEKTFYPVSSAQKRLYIHHQMKTGNISYNLCAVMDMEGALDRERFADTFRKLIDRHENLRTSFHLEDEEPVQKIHEQVEFDIEYFGGGQDVETTISDFIRPFDLALAPLLRVGLIETGKTSHVLVVDMHHIITDGTSLGIMVREFAALYDGQTLPPLHTRYRDFSEWQNNFLQSPELEKQRQYWLERFGGGLPELDFPTDFPRGTMQSFAGGEYVFHLEEELTAGIKQIVLDSGATLSMFLLAVYNILLSRYTGQEDIIIGCGIAGRRHADLDNIVGLFINMLAMRNRLQNGVPFMKFLEQVKTNALDAYANQDVQFESLIRDLGLQGKPGRNPLFDFVLQMQNMDLPEVEIPGFTLKPHGYEHGTTHFDQVVYSFDHGDIIELRIVYTTALFKKSTVQNIAKHFGEILEQVVKDRQVKLEEISLSQELIDVESSMIREQEGDFEF